jgi:ATP-binding cassette subfamily C (CFTR/MRP) protein 1
MDEATANIDEKTDQAVQALIKIEFLDTTVITIAHGLNTIIQYDKLLVLNHGQVEEFGSPRELLTKEVGYFRDMVMDNGEDYFKEMMRLVEEGGEVEKKNEEFEEYFADLAG